MCNFLDLNEVSKFMSGPIKHLSRPIAKSCQDQQQQQDILHCPGMRPTAKGRGQSGGRGMRRNGRPVVYQAQSAIRATMQHYNNVHFYGQLTAADAINALSDKHQWNANARTCERAKLTAKLTASNFKKFLRI
ncbi:hypothetical protein ACLKA6_005875 [Drosophila palustris]